MPPIFEYECLNCHKPYEVFYKSLKDVEKEEPQEKCVKCSSTDKKRVPSKTNFILKGRGWYARHQSGE